MAQLSAWMQRDLARPNHVQALDAVLCEGDSAGNRIGVELTRNDAPYPVQGAINGYVIKSDGTTKTINSGGYSGNKAWIDLPEDALDVPGNVQISIRLTSGGERTVLASCIIPVIQVATSDQINA